MKITVIIMAMIAGLACAQDVNDLISVNVTVSNKAGFVLNVPESAFTILEDGKPQAIKALARDNRPVSIGVIVDDSGSMRDLNLGVVRIIEKFLKNIDSRDELFLLQFNQDLFLTQDFTSDAGLILKGLQLGRLYGPSRVLDALDAATRHIIEHAANEKQVLILLSDGMDNTSITKRDSLVRVLTGKGIIVYALGTLPRPLQGASFNWTASTDRGKERLVEISRPTGGVSYASDDLDKLAQRAEQIAHEIHSQYVIRYSSSNAARDGKFRKIEVKVRPLTETHADIRARSGYYPPGP